MSEIIRPPLVCDRCGKPFPIVEKQPQYRCGTQWNRGLSWPITVRLCDVCWQTSEYRMPTPEQVASVMVLEADDE